MYRQIQDKNKKMCIQIQDKIIKCVDRSKTRIQDVYVDQKQEYKICRQIEDDKVD